MSRMEKLLLVFIVALALLISLVFISVSTYIDNNGGVEQIIIDAGKDVKRIAQEIKKDD